MEDSIQFYSNFLGFKTRIRGSNERREMTFMYLECHPSFEIELIRDLVPTTSYSPQGIVNHLAFSVNDLDETMHDLMMKGITFKTTTPTIAIDGARTIFFEGPNGELLQLVER
jgi:lactoylglutathione lyase